MSITENDRIESATAAFHCLVAISHQLETIIALIHLAGDDLGEDHAQELFDIVEPLFYRVDIMNNRYAALIPTATQQ